jgi:hypothetical protein
MPTKKGSYRPPQQLCGNEGAVFPASSPRKSELAQGEAIAVRGDEREPVVCQFSIEARKH